MSAGGVLVSFHDSSVTTGAATPIAVSAANPLPVSLGGGGPLQVVGNVAALAADSGNPVKIGGVYNAALPTNVNLARADAQIGLRGALNVQIYGADSATGFTGTATNVDAVTAASTATSIRTGAFNFQFNGSTWDRLAKPRTNFKLPASAATNNAANIKASPGTVYSITGYSALAGGPFWLKFFDTAGVPNPAALAQFREYPLVAAKDFQWQYPQGLYFPTGIGVAIVQGSADLNNVAVAAGDVLGLVVEFL